MLYSKVSGAAVHTADYFSSDPRHTLCITGHREKNIPAYMGDPRFQEFTIASIRLMLYKHIEMAIESGYTDFISGLAMGTDLWAAEYLLHKRRSGKKLRLIGAMPYLRHAERYPPHYVRLLNEVEQAADLLVTVNETPDITYNSRIEDSSHSKTLYRDRNYFMVDRSSAVIAFLNEGSRISGTFQTVSYASRKGLIIGRFGVEDIFPIIDKAGTDIRMIGREMAHLENVFKNKA